MRIAFISTWKARCGISTYTMHLAEELVKKHSVMVFAEERDVSGYDDCQNSSIPFTECWSRDMGFRRLLDEVRRFGPDVVHVEHEFSLFPPTGPVNSEFLSVCRKIRAPLVITYHAIPIPSRRYWAASENLLQRALLERALKRPPRPGTLPLVLRREIWAMIYEPAIRRFFADTDGIFARKIVHNQKMHSLAVTRYGMSNVTVINHGVTPCRLLDMKKCRRRLGVPEEAIMITSFGFVSESKGLMELIEIIRQFEESESVPVRFYHVGGVHGTGMGESYMKQCLRKIANMDSIKITGYVPEDELPEYYSASDIFILNYSPGTAASASGWAANLMSAMRPLLTTQDTNRTEEIIHNYNCVKVPYNDSQAMLSAIRELVSNRPLYSKIVEGERRYSQENSWEKIARKHEVLYGEIIDHEALQPTTSLRSLPRLGSGPPTFEDLKAEICMVLPSLKGWCDVQKACAMMDLISEVKPDVCVEIGVFAGASALPTAAALKFLGHGVLYAIDPWDNEESVRNVQEGEVKEWWSDLDMDKIYRSYVRLTYEFGLEEYCLTLRETSASAAAKIHTIDILHIDGNHSESSSFFDVSTYLPKVKHGGYIWFDDPDWVEGRDGIHTTKKAVEYLENCCTLVRSGSSRRHRWLRAVSSKHHSWLLFRKN